MAISKKKRFGIFKRDGFQCQYCGRTPPQVVLEVDHIIPRAEGGGDVEINLITSCFDCNRGKGSEPLTTIPETVKEKHNRQREAREQLNEYNDFLMQERALVNDQIEELGLYWYNQCAASKRTFDKLVFGKSRVESIRRFLERLTCVELIGAIESAHSRLPVHSHKDNDDRTWRYFCGICWKTIKEREA